MLELNLDSLDGLDEGVQKLYSEKEGGGFSLSVNGLPDTEKLETKRRIEAEHRKNAEDKASELEKQLNAKLAEMEALNHNKAKDSGDLEALEKSWQEKLNKMQGELTEQLEAANLTIAAKDKAIFDKTAATEAVTLAASLAVEGASEVLLPHIQKRLGVTERDGVPTTTVLDVNGKPSAATLDELKQEFIDNPAFSKIISGSKATGSGADLGGGTGEGFAKNKQFSDMSIKQKAAYLKSKTA